MPWRMVRRTPVLCPPPELGPTAGLGKAQKKKLGFLTSKAQFHFFRKKIRDLIIRG